MSVPPEQQTEAAPSTDIDGQAPERQQQISAILDDYLTLLEQGQPVDVRARREWLRPFHDASLSPNSTRKRSSARSHSIRTAPDDRPISSATS